jgi:hypothetical protein
MPETPEYGLPLIAAGQAQKHVTVNEAFLRIDALFGARIQSAGTSTPPSAAMDGAAYVVPSGATEAWNGHEGEIALWINGGWDFVAPRRGWAMFDEDIGRRVLFDGTHWIPDAQIASAGGAATLHRVVEIDHAVSAGAVSAAVGFIPAGSQVIGVTARVIETITGSATGWSLGVSGSANRYGSGLGTGLNSFASGLSGAPVSYYSDTDLLLTAEGGEFAEGMVRLAVHLVGLLPPRAV